MVDAIEDYDPGLGDQSGVTPELIRELDEIFADELNAGVVAAEAGEEGAFDRLTPRSAARFRGLITTLAKTVHPIDTYIYAGVKDGNTTGLIIASRSLAEATYLALRGDWNNAQSRTVETLNTYYPQDRAFAAGNVRTLDPRNNLTYLRLLALLADCREATVPKEPDYPLAQRLFQLSNGFAEHWLDSYEKDVGPEAVWPSMEPEHFIIDWWTRNGARPRPDGGSEVAWASELRTDLLTKIAVRSGLVTVSEKGRATPLTRATVDRWEVDQLDQMKALLESIHARQDHQTNIALDIKYDQQMLLNIQAAANEKRREAARVFVELAVPFCNELDEKTQGDLLSAELAYRAVITGEVDSNASRQVAMQFAVAAERELRRVNTDPWGWRTFSQLRNRAAHSDQDFGVVDLERIRSLFFGLGSDKDGIIAFLSKGIHAKRRR